MSVDCYCDYDPPSVYSSKTVKARKAHRCDECRRTIAIGERYKYTFGVWEGYPTSHHMCSHCAEIQSFVTISLPCFCWYQGTLLDDAQEAIQEAYARARDEVRGIFVGFGRRVIAGRRAHQKAAAS